MTHLDLLEHPPHGAPRDVPHEDGPVTASAEQLGVVMAGGECPNTAKHQCAIVYGWHAWAQTMRLHHLTIYW